MNARQILILGSWMLSLTLLGPALADESQGQYVQIAELEIDPEKLESYKAAVQEQISAAIRLEPGVLVLYAVSEKDNPAHFKLFEVYDNIEAYKAHLQAAHFKTYKQKTIAMVTSLKLIRVNPVLLGAK